MRIREGDVLMSDDRSIAVQTMTSLTGVNVIQVSSRLCSGFYNETLTMNSTIKVSKRPTPKLHVRRVEFSQPKTAILYKSLGIGSKQILALAGVYGTVAFLSNAITTAFLTDQWGRRK